MSHSEKFKEIMNDKTFLNETLMGPNCLRLVAELTRGLPLTPQMRIMDLGCGTGLTSMFLAEMFGAAVFATDLWVDPTDNWNRFRRFGLDDRIVPIHAEAHDLPYARGFFDAVVSVDSYHYFGAKEGYLEKHLTPLLKPGGLIAVAVPGMQKELPEPPRGLLPFWADDMHFHSCGWWRDLWERSGAVEAVESREMAEHDAAWADWLECDNTYAQGDVKMMEAEAGRYFNSVALLARRLP